MRQRVPPGGWSGLHAGTLIPRRGGPLWKRSHISLRDILCGYSSIDLEESPLHNWSICNFCFPDAPRRSLRFHTSSHPKPKHQLMNNWAAPINPVLAVSVVQPPRSLTLECFCFISFLTMMLFYQLAGIRLGGVWKLQVYSNQRHDFSGVFTL